MECRPPKRLAAFWSIGPLLQVEEKGGSGSKIKAFSIGQPRDVNPMNPMYMKFGRLCYGRATSTHVITPNLRSVRPASQTAGKSFIWGPDSLAPHKH